MSVMSIGGVPKCPSCHGQLRILHRDTQTVRLSCPGCGQTFLYNPATAAWIRTRPGQGIMKGATP